jgi:hypothetical protein
MVATMTFTATATRTGQWWMIQCNEHPAALSQVRSLSNAAAVHAEAIAFVTGHGVDPGDVVVEPALPPTLAEMLREVEQLRAEIDERSERAARQWRAIATSLTTEGWSIADTARALHVSPQRISQLIDA